MTERYANLRIRSIKPEFFASRSMVRCSPHARLTFAGLWCLADDWGRGPADPLIVRTALWGLEVDKWSTKDVHAWLDELHIVGSILRYTVDGDVYYVIPHWREHQSSAYRTAKRPRHPAPPDMQDVSLDPPEESCGAVWLEPPISSGPPSLDLDLHPRNREQGTGSMEQGTGSSGTALARRLVGFDEFWDAFGLKLDRKLAEKAYAKALEEGADPQAILEGAQRYKAWLDAHPDPPKQKYAQGWLNGKRWEDVLPPLPEDQATRLLREGLGDG